MRNFNFKTNHPDGVFALFFMQAFCMVGFAMLFSLLTLFCIHVMHFSDQTSYAISDAFNTEVFAVSILGGYLAGKLLGYRYAFVLSAFLWIAGFALLISKNLSAFYAGLAMCVLAQGMIVPSMYVLLGMLYEKNDPRRDSGFILSYIGMNVGGFLAIIFAGPLSQKFGYSSAFMVGLVCSVATLVNFLFFQYKFKPREIERLTQDHSQSISLNLKLAGTVIVLAAVPAITMLLKHPQWNNMTLMALGVLSAVVIFSIALRQADKHVRNKLLVFLALGIISMAFWALYLLVPTVLPPFTERNVNREFFSWLIPAASYSSLNPFFIITIGPVLSLLWMHLSRKNITVSTPSKLSVGVTLMGSGYLLLALGVYFHNSLGLISMLWLIGSYFLQTVGELFVGPIGYAMVGTLVPKNHEGLMMGIWQLFIGVAGVFTASIAKLIDTGSNNVTNPLLTNASYHHMFEACGSTTILIGILTFLLVPWLKRAFQ